MVVSIHARDSKTGERRRIVRMYEMKRFCDITEFEHSFLSETEIITRCETLSPQHLREMPQLPAQPLQPQYRCYLGGALVIATTRSALDETCTTGCALAATWGLGHAQPPKSRPWREP